MTSKYTLKNIRTLTGMEGRGFHASLYRDGTKVAEVNNDASGRQANFVWLDAKQIHEGKPIRFNGSEEAKRLHDFCNALPQREVYGKMLSVDPDWYVSEMVDITNLVKRIKRYMKTKVVIIEDKTISTIIYDEGVTPEILAAVRKANTNAVVLNGLSDDELAFYAAKALKE